LLLYPWCLMLREINAARHVSGQRLGRSSKAAESQLGGPASRYRNGQ
jgi:hypothetical protein